jgi:hypothetical protein
VAEGDAARRAEVGAVVLAGRPVALDVVVVVQELVFASKPREMESPETLIDSASGAAGAIRAAARRIATARNIDILPPTMAPSWAVKDNVPR